jgi:hypothetical protein
MQQLQRRGEGLWTADDPSFRVAGVAPVGTRMTVVRMRDGRLVLISPIRLDAGLRDEIGRLGTVAFIVAPSLVHHLFAAAAKTAFPGAKLLAVPGLQEKMPQIPFDGLVTDPKLADWREELQSLPVEGFPFLGEFAFFHPQSRTLILTDLCFNIEHAPWWAVPLFRLNGMWRRFGPSRIFRRIIRDRRALRNSIEQILRWDFDRVIVTHGEVLETGGPRALREAYAFL